MNERYLTILEVSQKQAYIFQNNELRSNVLNSADIAWITSGEYLEQTIHDKEIFSMEQNLVYDGGGHTILEFATQETAIAFTKKVTRTIRKDYPGIEIFAATYGYDACLTPGDNLKELLKQLERKKSVRLSAFHQGSFGVEKMDVNTKKPMFQGELGEQKSYDRMPQKEKEIEEQLLPQGFHLARKFEDLGGSKDESNFIAVVHIDGNAMGKRVESIQKNYGQDTWEHYKKKIRAFSRSIDEQFKEAYREMAEFVAHNIKNGGLAELDLKENRLPVRRIITAGDDICFVSEGRIGTECAAYFLRALADMKNAVDGKGYAACAGVAIVHQKYPFYKAYELAERLCSNAKKYGASLSEDGSGSDVSVIDWHIEFGEIKDTLEQIREDYIDADGKCILRRPYIVSASEQIKTAEPLRQYDVFKDFLVDTIWKEGYARGMLKELRSVFGKGEQEIEYYLKFHKMRKLLKENLGGRSKLLPDVVEMMDTFLPLCSKEEVQ